MRSYRPRAADNCVVETMYPPCGPRFVWQLVKLALFLFLLLLLAHSYRVLREVGAPLFLPECAMLALLLALLWFYRVEKYWVFSWGNERLTVFSGFNGFLRRWVVVELGDEVIMRYAGWRPAPEILRQQVRYGSKAWELEISISTTDIPGNVVCGVTIDGCPLQVEARSQDREGRS